jgi:acyl-coenzyme A thioesterase PaaI-like protein
MLGMIRRLLAEGVSALGARQLKLLFKIYLPYLGAGIRVVGVADDYSRWDVEMKLAHYNRNYFGTHFGGSLYSMCDPFFALIVRKMLGPGYIVWDKEATIRFKRPGRGRVRATFHVPRVRIEEIRVEVDASRKMDQLSPPRFATMRTPWWPRSRSGSTSGEKGHRAAARA